MYSAGSIDLDSSFLSRVKVYSRLHYWQNIPGFFLQRMFWSLPTLNVYRDYHYQESIDHITFNFFQ